MKPIIILSVARLVYFYYCAIVHGITHRVLIEFTSCNVRTLEGWKKTEKDHIDRRFRTIFLPPSLLFLDNYIGGFYVVYKLWCASSSSMYRTRAHCSSGDTYGPPHELDQFTMKSRVPVRRFLLMVDAPSLFLCRWITYDWLHSGPVGRIQQEAAMKTSAKKRPVAIAGAAGTSAIEHEEGATDERPSRQRATDPSDRLGSGSLDAAGRRCLFGRFGSARAQVRRTIPGDTRGLSRRLDSSANGGPKKRRSHCLTAGRCKWFRLFMNWRRSLGAGGRKLGPTFIADCRRWEREATT